MAKAVLMLALIKDKLNSRKLMNDCLKFDEKGGVRVANRIKKRMREVRDMSQSMYKDILETQKKEKELAKKNKTKELSDA